MTIQASAAENQAREQQPNCELYSPPLFWFDKREKASQSIKFLISFENSVFKQTSIEDITSAMVMPDGVASSS